MKILSVYAFTCNPLLGHGGVAQEIQWHPHQMALDLVEFLAHLLGRHERVVQVALLELVVPRQKGFVVVKGFDCVDRERFGLASFVLPTQKKGKSMKRGAEKMQ